MRERPNGAEKTIIEADLPMAVYNNLISIEALAPFSTRRWKHPVFVAYSVRMWQWILDHRETLGLVLTALIRDGFIPKELQSELKKTLIPLSEIIELKKMEIAIPATIRTPANRQSQGNVFEIMK